MQRLSHPIFREEPRDTPNQLITAGPYLLHLAIQILPTALHQYPWQSPPINMVTMSIGARARALRFVAYILVKRAHPERGPNMPGSILVVDDDADTFARFWVVLACADDA